MSISDNYSPIKELGNSVTTEFSGSWAMLAAGNERVYLESVSTGVQTLQVVTTNYTLEFDSDGFTVTFVVAPTSANYVVIARDVPLTQTDPYKTSKGFQGAVIENSLDKLTAIAQDNADDISRAPKFALGGSTDMVMPEPDAGKYIAWDATGTFLENIEGTGEIGPQGPQGDPGTGTVDSVATTLPIAGGPITTTGTIYLNINGATGASVATGDEFLFGDVSNSNAIRKATVAEIVALAVSGNSGWVAIKTVTASASTSVDFVNGSGGVVLDGTYKAYAVVISNCVPASDGVNPWSRTSTDGGSTYDSGASDYNAAALGYTQAGGTPNIGTTAAQIALGDNIGNATGEGFSGVVYIFDPAGTGNCIIAFQSASISSGGVLQSWYGHGRRASNGNVDAIRFLMSSGNITSGTFTLYGLASAS